MTHITSLRVFLADIITLRVTVLGLVVAELVALLYAFSRVCRHVVTLDLTDVAARHNIQHIGDRLASASSVI